LHQLLLGEPGTLKELSGWYNFIIRTNSSTAILPRSTNPKTAISALFSKKNRPAGMIRTNYGYEIDYTPNAHPLDQNTAEKRRKRFVNVS
jgi:hypothetical protein